MTHNNNLPRRTFIEGALGIGAAALLPNCIKSEASAAPAPSAAASSSVASSSKPETPDLRFGIIALTDNSPVVIAHEKGLFKKYGINSTIIKGASWAAIRDSLSNGDIQGTHMLLGMPLASTMGLLGSPKKPMIIPWLLNRNGQAIDGQGVQGQDLDRSQSAQAHRRRGAEGRETEDLCHDLSARHPRHVDALLLGRRRHQPGQGRRARHDPTATDGRQYEGGQDGWLLRGRALERARHRGRHRLHGH